MLRLWNSFLWLSVYEQVRFESVCLQVFSAVSKKKFVRNKPEKGLKLSAENQRETPYDSFFSMKPSKLFDWKARREPLLLEKNVLGRAFGILDCVDIFFKPWKLGWGTLVSVSDCVRIVLRYFNNVQELKMQFFLTMTSVYSWEGEVDDTLERVSSVRVNSCKPPSPIRLNVKFQSLKYSLCV